MKQALKNLEYFVGKAVTIITTPINRDFDERQKCDYFVGIVEAVDELGIMTQHPITACKNYYFYGQICSISEEQVLDSQNPDDAELIEELETKRRGQVAPPIEIPEVKIPDSPFVDIKSLSKLLKR